MFSVFPVSSKVTICILALLKTQYHYKNSRYVVALSVKFLRNFNMEAYKFVLLRSLIY